MVRTLPSPGFLLVALLAVAVALSSMRFLSFDPAVLAEELRPNLLDHPVPFYLHTTLAPIALLAGIWQFLPASRRGSYHRWAGTLYVGCCLLAAAGGFVVGFTTEAGPVAAAGFVILAVLWFAATCRAFLLARARRFAEHRRWMVRSYALTCAAISLRLILAGGMAAGFSFQESYVCAAWASWLINIALAEVVLQRRRHAGVVPLAARP